MTERKHGESDNLGAAMNGFFAEHGRCGDLESDVDDASVLRPPLPPGGAPRPRSRTPPLELSA
jgi:hypothetical protein